MASYVPSASLPFALRSPCPLLCCAPYCLSSEQHIANQSYERTTTARTDEVPAAPQLIARDRSSHRNAVSTSSHATTLVHHRRQSSPLSTQALAAIVICSSVVFCALVGCLLQLPGAFYSWRRRVRSYTPTGTQSTTPNTAELPDAEVGDQPMIPMARYLSPPPPYTRTPPYESERDGGLGGGTPGERSACAP